MSVTTLLDLAGTQLGLLTASQALRHGVSRTQLDRLAHRGFLEFLGQGVWRVKGSAQTWEQGVLAGCWRTGGTALISMVAAIALHGLWGARRCRPEVLVVKGNGARVPGVVRHETRWLTGADISSIGPIPVTSPERTVIDVAALMQPQRTERVLDDVIHKELTTARRVADHLGSMPTRGRTGAGHLWLLLAERTGDPEVHSNAWENAMARLLARSDLPTPVRQQKVAAGGTTYYLDFAWPDLLVALECDSALAHSGGAAHRYDLDRQHDCETLGWRFKRFLPSHLRGDPAGTLAKIRHELLAAGWSPP